jgi:hypothetical protein
MKMIARIGPPRQTVVISRILGAEVLEYENLRAQMSY